MKIGCFNYKNCTLYGNVVKNTIYNRSYIIVLENIFLVAVTTKLKFWNAWLFWGVLIETDSTSHIFLEISIH